MLNITALRIDVKDALKVISFRMDNVYTLHYTTKAALDMKVLIVRDVFKVSSFTTINVKELIQIVLALTTVLLFVINA